MKTVLILGADGYLGWPTAMHFAAKGYNVHLLDNYIKRKLVLETNSQPLVEPKNLHDRVKVFKYYFPNSSIHIHIGDIADYNFINKIIPYTSPDAIIHYGEQPSGPYSLMGHRQGALTIQNNVIGTYNVLMALKTYNRDCHLIKLGCYDSETEVLTDNGWKKFTKLTYEDKVCTLNPDTEEIIFENPSNIVHYDYKGKMLAITTKPLDFLITPNHRVVYKTDKNKGLSEIKISRADEIDGKLLRIPRSGNWNVEDKENFVLPEIEVRGYYGKRHTRKEVKFPMNDWLDFFGWYISEGSIRCYDGEACEVHIPQSIDKNPDNVELIQNSIESLGFNYTIVKYPEDGMVRFEIANNHLANYLSQFGKCDEKFIPSEIKNCSKDQLQILFNSLMLGDGYISASGTEYYHTTSKRLIDDIQEIVLKLGKAGTVSVDRREGYKDCYYISIGKNINSTVNPKSIKSGGVYNWVDYDGKVHCCTVSTGIIMVRRNGKAAWSGNTAGEYGESNVDIPDGWLEYEYKGRKDKRLFPRQAGSLYHTTKILDTDLIWFFVRMFELKVTDLMQGPVYGVFTKESELNDYLLPALYYDDIFGTVINRFIVQAVADHPLTVYGKGDQKRGYLNIIDTLQCVDLALENPAKKGELRILNQITQVFSVNDIANMVREAGKIMGFNVSINHIKNPRIESEDHYYHMETTGFDKLGLKPHLLNESVLLEMLKYVYDNQDNIDESKILPRVKWDK